MSDNVLTVLTFKSIEHVLEVGGTQSWALDRARARACKYAVLCRNARSAHVEGPEAHGSAFLVGRISDVVPSTDTEGRWLVLFSEYAHCAVDGQWEGRNPIRFRTTAEFEDLDFETLSFQPMPAIAQERLPDTRRGLTIAEAKAGLSLALGVPPSAIEITIRG